VFQKILLLMDAGKKNGLLNEIKKSNWKATKTKKKGTF